MPRLYLNYWRRVFALLAALFICFKINPILHFHPTSELDEAEAEIKTILLYTGLYSSRTWFLSIDPSTDLLQCPGHWDIRPCRISEDIHDPDVLHRADAVVFHQLVGRPGEVPRRTNYNRQLWVWAGSEAPGNLYFNLSQLGSNINVTMHFMRAADIVVPYGYWYRRREAGEAGERGVSADALLEKVSRKTRFAAWAVSHCRTNSQREVYIQALQEHLPARRIDIYSTTCTFANEKCGCSFAIRDCDVDKTEPVCLEKIATEYKFYFAFENCLCEDYITEKFWAKVNAGPVVPVVFGNVQRYEELAPANSYIDASKFASVKELARYLTYLDGDPSAYVEYLMWREYSSVVVNNKPVEMICSLCDKLHDPQWLASYHKVYKDMDAWYNETRWCLPREHILNYI